MPIIAMIRTSIFVLAANTKQVIKIEYYDEYLSRIIFPPSEKLHQWLANRLIKSFESKIGINKDFSYKFLEIGAGSGRIAKSLKNRKYVEYVGTEMNFKLLQYLKNQNFDIRSEKLPKFSEEFHYDHVNSFDCVISLHVIEHASNFQDARNWMNEMSNLTKPGGFILVMAPNILDYKEYFWDGDWSHGFPTSPNRINQLGKDLGLVPFYCGSAYAGSTNFGVKIIARILNSVIPHRLLDFFFLKISNRRLVSGLKIALMWGLTFCIFQKPNAKLMKELE